MTTSSSWRGEGLQAEISEIRAYFPGDPRAFTAEIQEISKETDLATIAVNMQDLKRPVLSIDASKTAAQPGEPIVLMGYATGLAAILARTDEDTSQQILSSSGGDISQVLDELARRNLIRPLITQGHIGDVLPDKIVFDAQTTSGGSGGPLINPAGQGDRRHLRGAERLRRLEFRHSHPLLATAAERAVATTKRACHPE